MPLFPMTAPPQPLLLVLAAAFLALIAGSVARVIGLRHADPQTRTSRMASLTTWWVISCVVTVSLLLGRTTVGLLMAAVSGLAFREFLQLIGVRDRLVTGLVGLTLLVSYGLLITGRTAEFFLWTPLMLPVATGIVPLVKDQPHDVVRRTGGAVWGGLLLIYGLGHAVLLYSLPETTDSPPGAAGWFLYLIMLTELNDIAQAIVGRRFGAHGKHPIAPVVSPHKTWEGFLGGLVVTVLLAWLMAPWLTTLDDATLTLAGMTLPAGFVPPLAGLLIAVLGYFGDITMSAVKRDAGVKDSGDVLPGVGGMIDRIDSLTWTAPGFAYFVMWVM